ncbi:uncharacterized protein BDV14DRAFT_31461 [Aspergillus stella-maris]|uniref:uncharacterized protein n=1 Tax=Aspergillus stella-maris TaxID=1810926 RepID=UPI003CCDD64C
MTTYIHRTSTCLLDEALNPKYRPQQFPNAATPQDQVQFLFEITEQVFELHARLFPQWWKVPPPNFNQHVTDVRESVHRSFRNAGYLNEIHQFFLMIRPLVRDMNPDNEFWTTGRDERPDNETQESMNSVPRYLTRARVQSQPPQQTQQQPQSTVQIYETEMDIDSDSDMESEIMAAVTRRQILSTSRTVPGRQPGRWGQVQRRQVEGDCTICLNPLVRMGGSQIHHKPPNSIGKGCLPGGIDHPPRGKLETHCPCSDDEVDDLEEDEIVWCRAFCGTNYHFDCIDEWLDQSINVRASCPTCRRPWYH